MRSLPRVAFLLLAVAAGALGSRPRLRSALGGEEADAGEWAKLFSNWRPGQIPKRAVGGKPAVFDLSVLDAVTGGLVSNARWCISERGRSALLAEGVASDGVAVPGTVSLDSSPTLRVVAPGYEMGREVLDLAKQAKPIVIRLARVASPARIEPVVPADGAADVTLTLRISVPRDEDCPSWSTEFALKSLPPSGALISTPSGCSGRCEVESSGDSWIWPAFVNLDPAARTRLHVEPLANLKLKLDPRAISAGRTEWTGSLLFPVLDAKLESVPLRSDALQWWLFRKGALSSTSMGDGTQQVRVPRVPFHILSYFFEKTGYVMWDGEAPDVFVGVGAPRVLSTVSIDELPAPDGTTFFPGRLDLMTLSGILQQEHRLRGLPYGRSQGGSIALPDDVKTVTAILPSQEIAYLQRAGEAKFVGTGCEGSITISAAPGIKAEGTVDAWPTYRGASGVVTGAISGVAPKPLEVERPARITGLPFGDYWLRVDLSRAVDEVRNPAASSSQTAFVRHIRLDRENPHFSLTITADDLRKK